MLMDAILKLHDKIKQDPLGERRAEERRRQLPVSAYEKPAAAAVRHREEAEQAALPAGSDSPGSSVEPVGAVRA